LTRDIGFVILRSHTETNISHMRTKTLLLTAALTAAGVATSMAQVYSVNMVGYINQPVPSGYSMIANHLNGTPDNLIINLFPAPPEETTVYKFDASTGGYFTVSFVGGAWEGRTDLALAPGEGAFISTPTAFTQTFVGEVQLASSVSITPGYQIVSSVLPQSLPVEGATNDGTPAAPVGLGLVPQEEDTVYRFDRSTSGYFTDSYVGGAWEGASGGNPPTPGVGEAFWISRAASGTTTSWTRNFVVGVD
jgi:hypothetical protein